MSVDVFGRRSGASAPGIGYKLTAENQYDVDEKRLCNLADPQDDTDATNKRFLQSEINKKLDDHMYIEKKNNQIIGDKVDHDLRFLLNGYYEKNPEKPSWFDKLEEDMSEEEYKHFHTFTNLHKSVIGYSESNIRMNRVEKQQEYEKQLVSVYSPKVHGSKLPLKFFRKMSENQKHQFVKEALKYVYNKKQYEEFQQKMIKESESNF